mmetsp:Transcript_39283/g.57791  ORF Transcript_39283/g.57791 Transcript_39283/m.57791 type:complete len:82 (-) Transcript_39283:49-294(-)
MPPMITAQGRVELVPTTWQMREARIRSARRGIYAGWTKVDMFPKEAWVSLYDKVAWGRAIVSRRWSIPLGDGIGTKILNAI